MEKCQIGQHFSNRHLTMTGEEHGTVGERGQRLSNVLLYGSTSHTYNEMVSNDLIKFWKKWCVVRVNGVCVQRD
jgi:hypothetical protein